MPVVTITLNNKQFQMGCNDGEESALLDAAQKLSQRIEEIKLSSPRAPTELLLIFCAIAMQDENTELRERSEENSGVRDTTLLQSLTTIAEQLEELAKKIVK